MSDTNKDTRQTIEELAAAKGKPLQRQLPGFDAGADRIERRRGGPVD